MQDHHGPKSFAGRRVTIMGLGLFGGGAAAARYFAKRGARVTVTDLRTAETLAASVALITDANLGVTLVLGRHREEDFTTADILVVNPAVKPGNRFVELARAAGVRIEREIHVALKEIRARGVPMLGVTGSNGKSTTAALLAAMIGGAEDSRPVLAGNIGRSALDSLENLTSGTPLVLELSSFQLAHLDEIGIAPEIAVVTNLTPNHLDWHGCFDHYAGAKRKILAYQGPRDVAVLNRDDPATWPWAAHVRGRLCSFGLQPPDFPVRSPAAAGAHYYVSEAAEPVFCEQKADRITPLCPTRALRLPGRHNLLNALAACAAARAFGVSAEAIAAGLAAFKGLAHRLEHVATVRGVRYINDSIATTPESTVCSLETFSSPVTLIAGGYDKGLSFAELGAAAIRARVRRCILIGQTAERIAAAIEASREDHDADQGPEVLRASTLEHAAELAAAGAKSGEVVLLSPACASYDMYTNFAERGDRFRAAVRAPAR